MENETIPAWMKAAESDAAENFIKLKVGNAPICIAWNSDEVKSETRAWTNKDKTPYLDAKTQKQVVKEEHTFEVDVLDVSTHATVSADQKWSVHQIQILKDIMEIRRLNGGKLTNATALASVSKNGGITKYSVSYCGPRRVPRKSTEMAQTGANSNPAIAKPGEPVGAGEAML